MNAKDNFKKKKQESEFRSVLIAPKFRFKDLNWKGIGRLIRFLFLTIKYSFVFFRMIFKNNLKAN